MATSPATWKNLQTLLGLRTDLAKKLAKDIRSVHPWDWDLVDEVLATVNKEVDGWGVEVVEGRGFDVNIDPHYVLLFVDRGDTSIDTLLFDIDSKVFTIGPLEDWAEGPHDWSPRSRKG